MNSYTLSRNWFNWCFENPENVTPNHTAVYFFAIEHCNRLGWKEKFSFPSTMCMEAVGIKSYNTYKKVFNDLCDFGFIKLIKKSTNQYSSNIIALSEFDKALDKALDKAMTKHYTKQSESTVQSIDSIIKQINKEHNNNINEKKLKKILLDFFCDDNYKIDEIDSIENKLNSESEKDEIFKERENNIINNKNDEFKSQCLQDEIWIETVSMQTKKIPDEFENYLTEFNKHLITGGEIKKSIKDYKYHFTNWIRTKANNFKETDDEFTARVKQIRQEGFKY